MSVLVTSDIHLTDHDRDSYRWGLFPWIQEQIEPHRVDTILFLGDITDAKDKHSAKLTNRIVDEFTKLAKMVSNLYILRGNHDHINEATPFFRFLNHIPNINFVIEQFRTMTIGNRVALLLPNTKDFANVVESIKDKKWDYLFCHQTFRGSVVENGTQMDGLDPHMFDNASGIVICGDVHVPQTIGEKIMYVGSPYPIHFGDSFWPRVLLIDDEYKFRNLRFQTLKKHMVDISDPRELRKAEFRKGDQVKVRLILENPLEWEEYKKDVINFCRDNELDLYQIKLAKRNSVSMIANSQSTLKNLSPQELFNKFCEESSTADELKSFGERIINDSTKAIST